MHGNSMQWKQKSLELIEDVEFLLESGLSGDEIVAKLETTTKALNQRLWRWGRNDLAKAIGWPQRPYKPRDPPYKRKKNTP